MSDRPHQKSGPGSTFATLPNGGVGDSRTDRVDGAQAALGSIDGVADGSVQGWVKSLADDAALVVDVFVDTTPLVRAVVADMYRQDVEQAGFGTGRYGFACKVPGGTPLSGRRLEVRPAGENSVLLSRIVTPDMMPGGEIQSTIPVPQPDQSAPEIIPPADPAVIDDPVAPPHTGDLIGGLDRVMDRSIEGWVKSLASDASLELDFFVDGVAIARAVAATIHRQDVEQAGIGTGRYGFFCAVPAGTLFSGGTLEVRLAGSGMLWTRRTLTADMVSGPAADPAPPPDQPGPDPVVPAPLAPEDLQGGTGFTGSIDRVKDHVLEGWARGPDEEMSLVLDILVDDAPLAMAVNANKYRHDVEQAGLGTGWYGFACETETPLAGRRVDIRLAGSDTLVLSKVMTPDMIAGDRGVPDGPDAVSDDPVEVAVIPTACDGRIDTLSETRVQGWAVDTARPDNIFEIDLFVDGVLLTRLRNDQRRSDLQKLGKSAGLGGYEHHLFLGFLEAGKHTVTLGLPDGKLLHKEIETKGNAPRYALNAGVARILPSQTAIIVPIYNAAEDVKTCIERLLHHTPKDADIVLIDDASPDPRIKALLADAHKHPNFRILHNATNLGFTRTVNRGLAEIGRKHAILLNSDARVTPGWMQGLLRAARSRPRVATVTAMSDRAGAFSAPTIGNDNPLPAGVTEVAYARAFRQRSLGLYPLVPTGNGFCMFVNRACVDDIGPFDAEAFPRGYGEENDFCMRAGRAGWANLIDDRTYVFHDRSKSFGDAKTDLMAAGRRVVDERYPEYKTAIRVFSAGAEIGMARFRAAQALQDCSRASGGQPAILYVVSTQTGGTPQTNMDLMQEIADEMQPWLLRCNSRQLTLQRLEGGRMVDVKTHDLAEPVDPVTHRSGEYDAVVSDWLELVNPQLVHIRHLGWHSLSLPLLARAHGCPVVFSFHDFYAICPTVKLLDEQNVYCGGTCTRTEGDCKIELWPADSMPHLKNSWVHVWRKRFNDVLRDCDAFITTSHSARSRILAHLDLDAERFFVIPHGRSFANMKQLRSRPRHGEPVRILVPGNIDAAKGRDIITALVEHDRAGILQFHILGTVSDAATLPKTPGIVQHGPYARDDFARHVAAIGPHLGAVFSIWDETYCHTLTELWSTGVPAVVFDFPTVATRVRESGAGWVVPHEDIAALYDRLVGLSFDAKEQARADLAVQAWQDGHGVGRSARLMAAAYRGVYRHAAGTPAARPLIAVVAPASPNLNHAQASTEIRVWERTLNGPDRPCVFVRMAPNTALANIRDGIVDGVIVQRNALPPTMVEAFVDMMAKSGIRYLLDLDDDLFEVPEDKDPDGKYAAYAPLLEKITRSAAVVTTSTDPLHQKLTALNPRTVLVPNRLSERLWRGPMPARKKDGVVRAVYMGTVTHQTDFDLIAPALEAVVAEDPGFRVAIIGIQTNDLPAWVERVDIPDEAKSYAHFVPWLRARSEGFDFALAPLVNAPFNQLKSNLKAMDCGALGLPVLASDMPVYRALHGLMPGLELVGDHPRAWQKALRQAIAAAREGRTDRAAIRDWVLSEYGLAATLRDYDDLLLGFARPGDLSRLATRTGVTPAASGQKTGRP